MNVDDIHAICATPSIRKGTPLTEACVKRTYTVMYLVV